MSELADEVCALRIVFFTFAFAAEPVFPDLLCPVFLSFFPRDLKLTGLLMRRPLGFDTCRKVGNTFHVWR